MLQYYYADTLLASAWALEELMRPLDPHPFDAVGLTFDVSLTPSPSPSAWLHHWREAAQEPLLSLARSEGGYLLRFPFLADFTLDPAGRRIALGSQVGVNTETLRHLLLDQVLPRALAHQGRLVLHAAAVLVGERAVAWMGATGSGKSTLAASFHGAGFTLLTDDGVVINATAGGVTAVGTYVSLRLWPEALDTLFGTSPATAAMAHYSNKRRLLLKDFAWTAEPPQVCPLAAFFVLAPTSQEATVTMTQLSPSAAYMALIANAFQLDIADRNRLNTLLDAAAVCAAQVPVYQLIYPRRFSALPQVRAAVLDALCTIKPR